MKYYTLAKKINITHGHGDSGDEFHICPIDVASSNTEFHPLFKTPNDAERYKQGLDWSRGFRIVELHVADKN